MWTLNLEEKLEDEARVKGSEEANLAWNQAVVDQYAGPQPAPRAWFSKPVLGSLTT